MLRSAEMLQEFLFNQGWFPWLFRRFVHPCNFSNMHNGPAREQSWKWQESFIFLPSLSGDQLFCKVPSWFRAGGSSSSWIFLFFFYFKQLSDCLKWDDLLQMLAIRKKQEFLNPERTSCKDQHCKRNNWCTFISNKSVQSLKNKIQLWKSSEQCHLIL